MTDDNHRDKKLQSRSGIDRELNGVVTFNSSSSLFSAARPRILRLDPSDHHYFPYEPLKHKAASAVEDKDSGELQTFAGVTKREGDLLLFSGPLFIINSLLSESLCKLFACRPDAESNISRFVAWGNDTLEGFKCYYNPIRPAVCSIITNLLLENCAVRETTILHSHIVTASGGPTYNHEMVDTSCTDFTAIHIQKISREVEACLPGLLNYALYCLDDVVDIDGSVGPIKEKIALFLYCNLNRHWARDLYARMA